MSDASGPTAFGGAPRSSRFQPSVHQIPTPAVEERSRRYEPFVLNFWVVSGVALLMIFMGIGLQIALHISHTHHGFGISTQNILSFVSTQFLTSFFPTFLVAPLACFWSVADWMLRLYQPYVTLSEGNAPASRSILLDYIALNQLAVIYYSVKHRHYLINVSTLTALSVVFLQPLAGSLLQIRPVPHTSDYFALGTRTLALSPDIGQLDSFLASAGFTDAAVYINLQDGPFVHEDWTAAQFQAPPDSYLNGTLVVNTTGIKTEVNCVSPYSLNLTAMNGNYTASAMFPGGCSANLVFNPANGDRQYSVLNASNCAPSGLGITFQPVVFWFYLMGGANNNEPQVAGVYCNPTMSVFTVETSMNLNDGSLGDCMPLYSDVSSNNVTGSPLNGQPFNGVIFERNDDVYIQSRANAINSGVPGTIYRYASQQPNGLLSVFEDQYGFLNATTFIYTRHLTIAAQANYFGPTNMTIPARLTSYVPRLFVEPLPTYLLSALLIVIGLLGLVVHFLHERARRNLWLTSPPGSIAAIVSMTSRSGFGELLLPYDDERRMKNNLSGLKFCLDRRTGAIVAEEDFTGGESTDSIALLPRKRGYHNFNLGVDNLSPLSRSSFKQQDSL
ncbi:hypothetical protein PAXRUDRAFT_829886 [Paxillus rubicundulus Ve08.2h10]|uniref:Uncharacterized protein n=1 Tax=Paxillus rubicundulus Ve08.2h10 TaxID=930991 RepID=A0A0D0DUA4_9AGAM|nr:hypothetical protein PAXRUDRAFT_829886 [Paxillus rubicundulus Ve08.2h10]